LASRRGDTPIPLHPGELLIHIDKQVRDVHSVQVRAPDGRRGVPEKIYPVVDVVTVCALAGGAKRLNAPTISTTVKSALLMRRMKVL